MVLVDSHCHLDAAEFDDDREAIIFRARSAGVLQQLVPAVDAASWPKARLPRISTAMIQCRATAAVP